MLLKSASKILKQHQEELAEQGMRSLAIFGSVARNESTSKSDVDILIDFDSKRGLFPFDGSKKLPRKSS
jgi:predicted nucleotidyltransferase